MATTRRRWVCPGCGKGWQIPADADDPGRCPKCKPEPDAFRVAFEPHSVPDVAGRRHGGLLLRVAIVTAICIVPVIGATVVSLPLLIEKHREAARWEPLLLFDEQAPYRQTIYVAISVFLCMVPVWIVWVRRHPYRVPISALSIIGGWTCIGLIVAIVWSVMPFRDSDGN